MIIADKVSLGLCTIRPNAHIKPTQKEGSATARIMWSNHSPARRVWWPSLAAHSVGLRSRDRTLAIIVTKDHDPRLAPVHQQSGILKTQHHELRVAITGILCGVIAYNSGMVTGGGLNELHCAQLSRQRPSA